MPRDLDLTFDISTGALTLDRVVGNYVKRSETLTLSVTIVSNGASATIPSGLVGTLKPVNTYGTTLAQWTTFSQVGATNVYTASTTINAAAVTTLLGTTTEQANCVFDFAGAGVVESDTLALVLKNNVTRDDDTAPTALLNRNDFLVTNGTGLLVNVAAGYAANGAFVAAQASLAITNATNYIEVTAAGVASVNTTAFTAGSYPLATVVASAGAITSNTDLRAWITPKPATGGGVTSITGTANEITVTGTTTPTLSLPAALTFTAKTITGGTFASPSLTTPTIGDGTESAPSLSFTSDTNTGVYRPAADTVGIVGGGNDVVRMTGIASATDYLEIKNGIGVGSPLHVLAEGASANIGVHLQPKGSGLFTISDGTDFNKGIRFRSSSSAASAITLLDAVSTAGRVITFPDATGTLALVSGDLGTPSALVGTNISGTASGLTAGNATLAATVTVANEATDTSCFPLFATAATGSLAAMSNAGLTFNSATGLLSATLLRADTVSDNAVTGVSSADGTGVVGQTVSGVAFSASASGSGGAFSGYSFSGKLLSLSGDAGENFVVANNGQLALGGSGPSGIIVLKGSTSGSATITVSATGVLALPTGTTATNMTLTTPDLGTPSALVGTNITGMNASNISSGTLAAARMANAGVHTGDATGTFPAITLNAAQTGITSVGTLTGGATGAGFTVALGTSTLTGRIGSANNTLANADTTSMTAVTTLGAAGVVTNMPGTTAASSNTTGTLKIGNGTSGTNVGIGGGLIYAGAAIVTPIFGITAGGRLDWTPGGTRIYSPSDGVLSFVKAADSGFTRLCLGGTSSSYVSIQTSTTAITFGLGDGTAGGSVTCSGTLAVTGATTLTGNLTSNGALISTPQALTGAGAVNVTTLTTAVTTTAPAQALTLANGTNGQIKTIVHQALSGGGTWVLTPTTKTGYTTITSTAVGETCTLQFFTTIGWCILSLRGAIAA